MAFSSRRSPSAASPGHLLCRQARREITPARVPAFVRPIDPCALTLFLILADREISARPGGPVNPILRKFLLMTAACLVCAASLCQQPLNAPDPGLGRLTGLTGPVAAARDKTGL